MSSTSSYFFFNNTSTTELYTLSLHDALPISRRLRRRIGHRIHGSRFRPLQSGEAVERRDHSGARFGHRSDRKSTRLNSSHMSISYAVFCLKKKIKHDRHVTSISTRDETCDTR